MAKLLILKGLPASGKSTFARKLVAGDVHDMGRSWVRINNDDFRESLHNGHWSKHNEPLITEIRNFVIEQALTRGDNVVVDNLNLHPKHETQLRALAKELGAQFDVKFFDVDVEECIKRDLKRPNSVGEKVIRQWYNDYLKPKAAVYVPPKDKPLAAIFDIDGSLAHNAGGRGWYDYTRVHEDALDEVVGELAQRYHAVGYMIIICSGRKDDCTDLTSKWLRDNDVPYDHLYMRKTGDNRKDSIIKREIFDEHIRDNYQVKFVVDDRPSVCRMWRDDLGLKVLQVGDPHIEF